MNVYSLELQQIFYADPRALNYSAPGKIIEGTTSHSPAARAAAKPNLSMSKMKSLEDLFQHQLKDLYSAETQLLTAMPKMAEAATDKKLKKAFESHLKETQGQVERLEKIGKELGISLTGETCQAMKGLIKEAQGMIDEDAEPAVKDAGLIAEAQRVEHYEISGYGTAKRYATQLGHTKIAELLGKTLEQEKDADEKLNDLAINLINVKAEA